MYAVYKESILMISVMLHKIRTNAGAAPQNPRRHLLWHRLSITETPTLIDVGSARWKFVRLPTSVTSTLFRRRFSTFTKSVAQDNLLVRAESSWEKDVEQSRLRSLRIQNRCWGCCWCRDWPESSSEIQCISGTPPDRVPDPSSLLLRDVTRVEKVAFKN